MMKDAGTAPPDSGRKDGARRPAAPDGAAADAGVTPPGRQSAYAAERRSGDATVSALDPARERRRERVSVQGVRIDVLDWDLAVSRIDAWARLRSSRTVAICNSHSVVTARQDPAFAEALELADMATADGMPVAWMLRRLGHPTQARINGPDLMLRYCEHARRTGTSIFLYGNTEAVLSRLQDRLQARFAGLKIAGAISPPFRPMTEAEDAALVATIERSGAGVVFVSLGCPKQERWMHAHRGRIPAVMIGVGAAFDYHAGTLARAPAWMRDHGFEWLHRLASEPRRLWRRYLVTNTLFGIRAIGQLLRGKRGD
ncbi:MAG: WecB/TagA/CpsF family glycosyltransferase [Lautropia sp.]